MRRRLTVVVATLAAIALAMPALAAPSADTLLTAGYDSETMQWYYMVEPLEDEGDAEQTIESPEAEEPVDCADEGVTCFDGTGPNGQVNHGTVVSAYVQAFLSGELRGDLYQGIGCLVREIARNDWGKGDQQLAPGEAYDVPLESFMEDFETRCGTPDDDDMADPEESELESTEDEGNGPPPWAKAKKEKDQGGEFVPPGHQKKGNKPDRP